MHRVPKISLFLAMTLALAAPTVMASPRVVGEGFTVSVPGRFERLPLKDRALCPSSQLPLTRGLSTSGDPEFQIFRVGKPALPHAVLVVARIGLADEAQVRSRLAMQRYALDHLRLSAPEFEDLVHKGLVDLKPTRIDGVDALEMRHDGTRGALGLLGEPATRALVVRSRKFLLVVSLMVMDRRIVPLEETWQHVRRSIVIDPRGAFVKSALLYGGIGLAALILFVFLLRLRAQRRARAMAFGRPPTITVTSADDMHDEIYQPDGDPNGRPDPESAPAESETETEPAASTPVGAASTPAREPAAPRPARGTLKASLEAHRTEHSDAPEAPDPSVFVAGREQVLPDAAPDAPADPHEAPHSELERGVDAPPPPPRRKGLLRTRPESGRFSE